MLIVLEFLIVGQRVSTRSLSLPLFPQMSPCFRATFRTKEEAGLYLGLRRPTLFHSVPGCPFPTDSIGLSSEQVTLRMQRCIDGGEETVAG